MDEKKLLDMREKIEDAKARYQRAIGHLDALKKELKDDWGCKDVTEAEVALEKIKGSITKVEEVLKKKVAKIEEDWNG